MDSINLTINFFINLLAGIVGIFIVLWIERQRRPIIFMKVGGQNQISVDDPLSRPPAKWLYVQVHNKSMSNWLAWVYNREPALGCRAWVSFHHLDGHRVYDREMNGRWIETPEPTISIIPVEQDSPQDHPSTAAPKNMMTVKEKTNKMQFGRLMNVQETVDIPPGEHTDLDIVFRMQNMDECYGWCNESYLYDWKHPAWRMEKGRYIVKVRVKTGGKEYIDTFLLENTVPYPDFRLVHDPKLRKVIRC